MLRRAIVVGLVLVGLTQAKAATVNWSAQADRAAVLADGTNGVPQGDLIRLGYFDITVSANAANVTFLDGHLIELGSGAIGDGTGVDGTFTEVSATSGRDFPGQSIHVWVFDSTNLSVATQQAILAAPSNSQWIFPADAVLGVTSVDIGDSNVTAVIGSIGGAVAIPTNMTGSTAMFGSSAVLATIPGAPD